MPLQIPPKAQQDITIYGINGMQIRDDDLVADQSGMAELLNFDMHVVNGVATTRPTVRTIATLSGAVNVIKRGPGGIYAGTDEGKLYLGWSQIDSGYGMSMAIEEYTRLNQTTPTLYVAGDAQMKRVIGNNILNWGLARPASPPALSIDTDPDEASATGTIEGTYSVVYTYVVKEGNALLLESNPSPSATIVVEQPLTTINTPSAISAVVAAPTDSQITHIRVYRTQAGGASYLFDTEVQDTGSARTVTLFKPDNDLGAQVDEDNDPPIVSSKFVIFQDRAWLADRLNLYWSKKFQPESWPQLNFVPVGTTADPIVGIIASRYGLGVFTRRRRFRVLEQVEGIAAIGDTLPFFGGSSATFVPIPSPTERGGAALRGMADAEEGIIYASDDGIYVTDFGQLDQRVSDPINGLFRGRGTENIKPIDSRGYTNSVLGVHGSRRYFSFTEMGAVANTKTAIYSAAVGKWYVYNLDATAIYSDTDTNNLYVGRPGGGVCVCDDYSRRGTDSVTSSLITNRLHGGAPFLSKLLQYLYVDADIDDGDTLTATIYVNNVVRATVTVSTNRQIKVPAALYGQDFKVKLSYSGAAGTIRGMQLIWLPMRVS